MKKGGECGFREAANSEFNIQNSKLTAGGRCSRAAACGGRASGPADASAGLRGAKLRPTAPCGRKFRIQYSKFKITNRAAACGGRNDAKELRASAGRRLRPARSLQGRFLPEPAAERRGLHERTCGTRRCSPPPGGGCGLPIAARPMLPAKINAPRASFRRCPRRPPTARAASRPPPSPR